MQKIQKIPRESHEHEERKRRKLEGSSQLMEGAKNKAKLMLEEREKRMEQEIKRGGIVSVIAARKLLNMSKEEDKYSPEVPELDAEMSLDTYFQVSGPFVTGRARYFHHDIEKAIAATYQGEKRNPGRVYVLMVKAAHNDGTGAAALIALFDPRIDRKNWASSPRLLYYGSAILGHDKRDESAESYACEIRKLLPCKIVEVVAFGIQKIPQAT